MTRIIGIDFGTSTSVVRVKRYKNGEPVGDSFFSSAVTFGNGQGDSKAVTAVRRNSDGSFTCGREAEDTAPGAEIFREFKMELESPDVEKRAAARAVTKEFFQYLYRWYDHQRSDMGEAGDVEKTIVSFPVKWTEVTRRFMVDAAQRAGFPNVSGMDEPTAALYATLTRKMNDVSAKGLLRAGEPGYMLLIDMGAGTSDLAVCRYTVENHGGIIRAGQIKNEIVATWPESADAPTFGGREVDRLLEDYLTDYLSSCGLDGAMARQLVCGAASVKPWKENTVSALLGEGKRVDACGFLSGYMMLLPQKKPFPAIDRAKFEAMLGGKLTGFQSLVSGCLDRACEFVPDVAENGLDLVILTGGHSSWYFTEGLLSGAMPGISHRALGRVQAEKDRVLRLSNPQETVALGLVYSQLPLKVEDRKKEAGEAFKEVREDTEQRAREQVGEEAARQTGEKTGAVQTLPARRQVNNDTVAPPQTKPVYTVSIARKRQISGVLCTMVVEVDQSELYEIPPFGGAVAKIPVRGGSHRFTLWMDVTENRKFSVRLDISRDMDLTAVVGGMPDFKIQLKETAGGQWIKMQ